MRALLVKGKTTASAISTLLTAAGLTVESVNTGEEGLGLLRRYEFDVVVLQFVLPDMTGITFLHRLRMAGHNTAALAFNTVAQTCYRAEALAAGADDVVEHGIDHAELIARMHAIVRRSHGHSHPRLQVGALALDMDQQLVTANGRSLHLTNKEFAILQLLMLRKGAVLTKDAILTHIYGGIDEPEAKIVDVFICKIRTKLAKVGIRDLVTTVWGRGYTIHDQGHEGPKRTPVSPRTSGWELAS